MYKNKIKAWGLGTYDKGGRHSTRRRSSVRMNHDDSGEKYQDGEKQGIIYSRGNNGHDIVSPTILVPPNDLYMDIPQPVINSIEVRQQPRAEYRDLWTTFMQSFNYLGEVAKKATLGSPFEIRPVSVAQAKFFAHIRDGAMMATYREFTKAGHLWRSAFVAIETAVGEGIPIDFEISLWKSLLVLKLSCCDHVAMMLERHLTNLSVLPGYQQSLELRKINVFAQLRSFEVKWSRNSPMYRQNLEPPAINNFTEVRSFDIRWIRKLRIWKFTPRLGRLYYRRSVWQGACVICPAWNINVVLFLM